MSVLFPFLMANWKMVNPELSLAVPCVRSLHKIFYQSTLGMEPDICRLLAASKSSCPVRSHFMSRRTFAAVLLDVLMAYSRGVVMGIASQAREVWLSCLIIGVQLGYWAQ